jgi:hypothetical protein
MCVRTENQIVNQPVFRKIFPGVIDNWSAPNRSCCVDICWAAPTVRFHRFDLGCGSLKLAHKPFYQRFFNSIDRLWNYSRTARKSRIFVPAKAIAIDILRQYVFATKPYRTIFDVWYSDL